MPLPREILQRIAEERLTAQRAAERDRRRLWLWTGSLCVGWPLLGLFLLGWSMHTTDMMLGQIAFSLGILVGDGGTLATLIVAWGIAERKGWV